MDEFGLIAAHFAPLAAGCDDAFDLTDDAAVVAVADGHRLVVTKDVMTAGVHFMADDDTALVARKLLRVNLSDLAAMGAAPRAYLVGLAVPRGTPEAWFRDFAAGLRADQDAFGATLIGGDVTATDGPLAVSLTALGDVMAGAELRRNGAHLGDTVYVSGTLGDAALGLAALKGELAGLADEDRAYLVDRYRLPRPRVALGLALVGAASSAIDVSDGLVADLGHVCRHSKVAAEIDVASLPLSSAVARAAESVRGPAALTGGDDYELLFTAAADADIAAIAAAADTQVAAIGRIVAGEGVVARDAGGAPIPLDKMGYRHFQ